jgi:outer membrane immunogenic protein
MSGVMKRLSIAGAALVASIGAAVAADVAVPGPFSPAPAFPTEPVITPGPLAPPPAFPATRVYNWTGFYIGANAGYQFGSVSWSSVPDLVVGRVNASGGLAGGTVGYNLQTGDPWVIGFEGDMDWSGYKATIAPASCLTTCELQNQWLGTIRLRGGYAFDAVLAYLTAGVAIGRLDAAVSGAPFGFDGQNNLGWTVGGGVEVALTGYMRAKLEYLHVDLNGFSCNAPCGGGPISFRTDSNIVRLGVNFQLWK